MSRISLIAEQADRCFAHQSGNSLQTVNGCICLKVRREYALELVESTRLSRIAPRLGIAKPRQMNITHALFAKCGGQGRLGKALAARQGKLSDVDNHIDAGSS